MACMTQYQVTIYKACDDTVLSDGTNPGVGTMAYNQLMANQDISFRYTDNDEVKEVYIPFASVEFASITISCAEQAQPSDDTCPAE